uniref:Uncharacterized protein n=1 Tax=Pyramimonas orientalis virus TaxID=455367 RepID=A0A7M3UPB4_POV01|nr:hypothetical protein HWQ62_00462 [Pyramimonas orientalis virus]
MRINDQPGRMFAIFVLSPYLVFQGRHCKDKSLLVLGIIFFIYELFWVLCASPKEFIKAK